MLKLPGLIDIHVHLRDPGQTEKEDFFTGTCAAIAGGFTTVIDMPNNATPVTSLKTLKRKIEIAKEKTVCDIGFYAGSLGDNLDELMKMEPYVFGLKLYLNRTTGNYIIDKDKLKDIYRAWKSDKPILLHAESDVIEEAIDLGHEIGKRVHICHVASKFELSTIMRAKDKGFNVTCGVTPHHLFLTIDDVRKLGAFAMMKPPVEEGAIDFLWNNLDYIDVVESDHAPHTKEEKLSRNPTFGVPNLDTTLPLLLTAVSEGRLTLERLKELCFYNPKKIFNIKTDDNTYIEVDEEESFVINNDMLYTKCGWSPYEGHKVRGRVKRVFYRGRKVFEDGRLFVGRGDGVVDTGEK